MTKLVQACSIMSESLSERVLTGFSSLVFVFSFKRNTARYSRLFLSNFKMEARSRRKRKITSESVENQPLKKSTCHDHKKKRESDNGQQTIKIDFIVELHRRNCHHIVHNILDQLDMIDIFSIYGSVSLDWNSIIESQLKSSLKTKLLSFRYRKTLL